MQEATDRVVADGDLVAFDTDLVGARGYLTDVSRTYHCGDRRPTDEQRRLYQASYAFLQECLPELRPGASFDGSDAASVPDCRVGTTICAIPSSPTGPASSTSTPASTTTSTTRASCRRAW